MPEATANIKLSFNDKDAVRKMEQFQKLYDRAHRQMELSIHKAQSAAERIRSRGFAAEERVMELSLRRQLKKRQNHSQTVSRIHARARRIYEYGFTDEERGMELSLRRQLRKRQNHSQTVSRIHARARRIYEYGFADEERSMELSLRKQLKAEDDAYRKRVEMHAKALRENEAMDKRAEAASLARQSRLGAARGTVGRGAGQVFAGLRGGLSNMWVTGAGMSQMATGIGMYFPKIAGLMGGVGAFANVASNLASLVITVAQNVARAAASALKFGVNMAMGFGRAVVAVGKFVGRTILSGLERVWSLLKGIAGAAAGAAVKMGLLATAATAAAAWIGKSFADAYSKVEGFLAKMEVAFKDRNVAMAWLGWGQQTAMTTPFDTQEVVDSITRLALYGTQKFGTLTEWFKLTGDMAGAMSRSITDAVEAVVDVIYGGGMERIKEFGINSFELIQKGAKAAMGGGVARRTADEIAALVKALKAVMAEKFGGGMEKLRNTLHGLSSDIQDIVFIVKASIGSALAPALRILIPYIASLGKAFAAWIVPMAQRAAPVLEKVARKFVEWAEKMRVKVGEWWAKFAPKFAEAWKTMLDRISSYIESQGGWAGIWKKIADGAKKLWSSLKEVVAFLRKWVPEVWRILVDIGRRFREWIEGQGGLESIWQRVKQFGERVWNAVRENVIPPIQRLVATIKWAYDTLMAGRTALGSAASAVDAFASALGGAINWVSDSIARLVQWVQNKGGLDAIQEKFRAFWQELNTNVIPAVVRLWNAAKEAMAQFFGASKAGDAVLTLSGIIDAFAKKIEEMNTQGTFANLAGAFQSLAANAPKFAEALTTIAQKLTEMGNWWAQHGELATWLASVGGGAYAGGQVAGAPGAVVGGTIAGVSNNALRERAASMSAEQIGQEYLNQYGGDYDAAMAAVKRDRESATDRKTRRAYDLAYSRLRMANDPYYRKHPEERGPGMLRVQIVPPQGWTANPKTFAY